MAIRWRTAHNGIVSMPGFGSAPCPVTFQYDGSPVTGQVVNSTIANVAEVRMYYAGGSGLRFSSEFMGVLIPKEPQEISIKFPWTAWFIPETFKHAYFSTTGGLNDLQEMKACGYKTWRQRHLVWAADAFKKQSRRLGILSSKHKKRKIDGDGLRKMKAE